MSESTKHSNIAQALSAFQGDMPTVPKTKTATIPTKGGGGYKYQYADLADIMTAAGPLLAKHGLAFTTMPRILDNGRMILDAKLIHESDGVISGSLPIMDGSPQQIGSALTYMRRYLLGCLTGIVTDDDDDGHAATHTPRPAPASRPAQHHAPAHQSAPDSVSDEQTVMITDAQSSSILDCVNALELNEERLDAAVLWASKNRTTDPLALSSAEAGRLIGFLQAKLPAGEE